MIITDESLLRVKCDNVDMAEVPDLIADLEHELSESDKIGRPGIGLACPQIGIHKRVAIVRIPKSMYNDSVSINLVNAKIIKKYNLITINNEGCLSFPDLLIRSKRYNEIVVQNEVYPNKFIVTGLAAICVQHELDHLDGILLPDVAT